MRAPSVELQVLRHRVDGERRHEHDAAEHRRDDPAEDQQQVGAAPGGAPPASAAAAAEVAHGARRRQRPDVPGHAARLVVEQADHLLRPSADPPAHHPAQARERGGHGVVRRGGRAAGRHRHPEGAVLVDELDALGQRAARPDVTGADQRQVGRAEPRPPGLPDGVVHELPPAIDPRNPDLRPSGPIRVMTCDEHRGPQSGEDHDDPGDEDDPRARSAHVHPPRPHGERDYRPACGEPRRHPVPRRGSSPRRLRNPSRPARSGAAPAGAAGGGGPPPPRGPGARRAARRDRVLPRPSRSRARRRVAAHPAPRVRGGARGGAGRRRAAPRAPGPAAG